MPLGTDKSEASKMRPNMGYFDRIDRIIAGLVLLAYAIRLGFSNTGWNWVGWFGVVPLLTALVRYCPAYAIVGISTNR